MAAPNGSSVVSLASVGTQDINAGALSGSAEMSGNLLELQQGWERWDVATVGGFQNREFFSVMFRFRLYTLAAKFSDWEARVWIRRFASFNDTRLRVYFSRDDRTERGNVAFDRWSVAPKFGGDLPINLQQNVSDAWADLCRQDISQEERRIFWPGAIWSPDGRSATIAAPRVLSVIVGPLAIALSSCVE